ncbi:cytosolic sulfotransferase 14-like [Papaver somniferum]|uniref:cytosolic sulfotransferase 14-like n=1 Tax=Papaver somniferum TaxID=3469 RepID=UPI000E705DED|nr:cytosolic sulfotransferase 14-like [Papaver somniferum]
MASTNNNNHEKGDEISLDLPKGDVCRHGLGSDVLYQYQGFWRSAIGIESIKDFQQNFKALGTDLIIATMPKSGSIWLKALAFAIVNRINYPCSNNYHQHPLLTVSPHDLVPFIDLKHFFPDHRLLDFTNTITTHDYNSPCRVIATHVPYPSLAESIKKPATNCKIVYLCRNPQDTLISMWMFINKVRPVVNNNNSSLSIDEAFEFFYEGVSEFGPFWDHVLGYWKESSENPQKVLFLKYEDLKKEPKIQVKKLADFMGYSFSVDEEIHGVIEDIISLCSFEQLKNLDVNKNGYWRNHVENKVFFRKGEVGDSKNYLTPLMVERLDRLMEEKLLGSGLVFQN